MQSQRPSDVRKRNRPLEIPVQHSRTEEQEVKNDALRYKDAFDKDQNNAWPISDVRSSIPETGSVKRTIEEEEVSKEGQNNPAKKRRVSFAVNVSVREIEIFKRHRVAHHNLDAMVEKNRKDVREDRKREKELKLKAKKGKEKEKQNQSLTKNNIFARD